jgi:CheY-like chemotaxis protein
MDILMPGMDGFELAQRIRDAHWGSGLLLVALSGLGPEHDQRGRQTSLIDVHLTKPVNPDQLFRLLDEQPGRFGDDYYYRNGFNVLRTARNSVGRELFAVINGGK